MPLLMIGLVILVIYFLWKTFFGNKKIRQAVTKDQWERLTSDMIISAKLGRRKGIKWIGLTGDKIHSAQPKYMKYRGSVVDGRMINIIGRVKFYTPLRWMVVHWDLARNVSGKTLWISANDMHKDGYVFRPLICRSVMNSGHDQEYYDKLLFNYLAILFRVQGSSDITEQKYYETLSSMTHKERAIADLMQKNDQMQVEEIEPLPDQEQG